MNGSEIVFRATGRRAFTLVEVAAAVVVTGLVTALLGAGLDGARGGARGLVCQNNLRWQAEGYAQYAGDSRGQIASYSWRAGFTYETESGVLGGPHNDDMTASQAQQTLLLRRLTGREEGEDKIQMNLYTTPHRRFNHLPLLDYLGGPAEEMRMACPEDANLLASKADPLNEALWANEGSYGAGVQFNAEQVRQRYPFSSTYQTVPYAVWIDGLIAGIPVVYPIEETSHLYGVLNMGDQMGTRNISEVSFPDRKVYLFEHNDFHRSRGDPFYAYEQAECNQLFFDGSVAARRSGDAEPGWDPTDPAAATFSYKYTPLSTEPIPIGDPEQLLPVRYRFTRGGLKGFDYAGTGPTPDTNGGR